MISLASHCRRSILSATWFLATFALAAQSQELTPSFAGAPDTYHPTGEPKPAPRIDPPLSQPTPRFERPAGPRQATTTQSDKAPEPPTRVRTTRRDPNRIYHVEGTDGNLWVRGATYKASFGPRGASYIPFLGSNAPRIYPLTLRLAHASVGGQTLDFTPATAATRLGDTITLDHETLVEVYELGVTSIEQAFVFASLPSTGELLLRISVESELTVTEHAEGFTFGNERGGVRYGRAVALDAGGESIAAATTWTGSGLEIRVPAAFVARATFPVTIDPVISSFSVDPTTFDDFAPDVAFDATTNFWLTVYEEVFASVDHDIVFSLLTSNGTLLATGFVDGALTYNWTQPATANNNFSNQFLIVAAVNAPLTVDPQFTIRGRTFNTGSLLLGAEVLISTTDQTGDKLNPDVGGDPSFNSGSRYAVVWERVFTTIDRDIHARCVSQTGSLLGPSTILIDDSAGTVDTNPAIAKGNNLAEWGIVWQRQVTALNRDIRGALMSWDGTVAASSFPIDTSSSDDTNPDVSTRSDLSQYLVVYQRALSTDHDIIARLMSGTSTVDSVNLTALEDQTGAFNVFEDQLRPSTDSDGSTFVVAYAESFNDSSTDYDPRVTTLAVIANQLRLSEYHLNFPVGFSSTREDFPSVASAGSSGESDRRCFVVWHDAAGGTTLGDIEGGLYDAGQYTSFCHPGVDGTIVCPCSNPPSALGRGCNNGSTGGAVLACTGLASLAADSMLMSSSGELPTALSIFSQGTALTSPTSGVVFGQGLRCVAGSIKRLYTKNAVGGAAAAPTGADPDVSVRSAALGDAILPGSTRYYYVYYRQANILGGCPASSSYNSTQSVATIWSP